MLSYYAKLSELTAAAAATAVRVMGENLDSCHESQP